jgi:hypothetical protein
VRVYIPNFWIVADSFSSTPRTLPTLPVLKSLTKRLLHAESLPYSTHPVIITAFECYPLPSAYLVRCFYSHRSIVLYRVPSAAASQSQQTVDPGSCWSSDPASASSGTARSVGEHSNITDMVAGALILQLKSIMLNITHSHGTSAR